MTEETSLSRRRLLQRLALGVSLTPVAVTVHWAHADLVPPLPLLSVRSPDAKAQHYTDDATTAGRMPARGAKCANCLLYRGSRSSTQGPCTLFPGKAVMAAGWCKSWQGM